MNIEELKKQCLEAEKNFKTLREQLAQAEKEEEDKKKAELALEKEARKKEIEEAEEYYHSLIVAYIKDYGSYSATRSYDRDDDFPILRHLFF